ncbi:O-methyltransferase [Candidatus Latescibacterota bacterium]
MSKPLRFFCMIILLIITIFPGNVLSENPPDTSDIEKKVTAFLEKHRGAWRDMNVPESDGRVLHNIIVENGYTRALEIGTSTGHSGIWIALALSKTGGKLTTIDIDKGRHKEALDNFSEAGVSEFVDALLADAHELVPELEGPYDFIFVDADKGWYKRYLELLLPKLTVGGCFTAHNVLNRYMGMGDFLDYLESLDNMETTIDKSSRSGVSVSYKRKE